MSTSHIASNIRAELARRKKSQADLAKALGTTRQAVTQRLAGQTDFRVNELQTIAEYLDVSVAVLLADEEIGA